MGRFLGLLMSSQVTWMKSQPELGIRREKESSAVWLRWAWAGLLERNNGEKVPACGKERLSVCKEGFVKRF